MSVDQKKVIFSMENVCKNTPMGKEILKNIYLSFYYGAKIGILGLNGSGKSTLMKMIAGLDTPTSGNIVWSPGYSVGYLSQEPKFDETKTVKEVVQEGFQDLIDLMKEYDAINEKMGLPEYYEDANKMDALLEKQGKLQDEIDAQGAWDLDAKVALAMSALNTPPADRLVSTLSGGERRRVALCRLLLQEPDILLLDEPTNHLDAESVHWLEQYLAGFPGTVLCVTHDRYFLDNVAGWILELDRGSGIPWKGNYSEWLDQKAKRLATEEKIESKRQKVLKMELEWVRKGAKGRQSKSKARLNNYEEMLNEENKEKIAHLEIPIPNGPRLGNLVIEANDISKTFGDRLLYEHLSFALPPNGIVGIVGPNGIGKTTLFRMIMGEETPDTGTFKIGETVKIGYVDQSHKEIDPNKTVWEVISGGHEIIELGSQSINSRAYCSRFNFTGPDQQKKVGVLSGGERNRLHLAMTLKTEANVLLLDEPTNDLDVNTLRALEEGILNFAGCAVIISHDRWFLDRICTHILAYEGKGSFYFFQGTYTEYEENKQQRLGQSLFSKSIQYKKLKRD